MTPPARPPVAPADPHLVMSLPAAGTLLVKGLVSDRRERRGAVRTPDGRPLRRALDPRVHDPVFVVGAPRSGTTFLGDCLGALPGVSYHFEPRLTKALVRHVHRGDWSRRRAAAAFRASYSSLVLAAGDGGRRFVDKTPENAFITGFLADAFPTARFVHIIRDGRDVTVSHAEKPWLRASSTGSGVRGRGGAAWGASPRFWVEPEGVDRFPAVSDLERSAWAWRRFTTAALEGLEALPGSRWTEVRYEELVTRPAPAVERLAALLELDDRSRRVLADGLSRGRASSVGRWRERLGPEEEALVVAECGPLLPRLGYVR